MRHVPPLAPPAPRSTLLRWATDADLRLSEWSESVDGMSTARLAQGAPIDDLIGALGLPSLILSAHEAACQGASTRHDVGWRGGELAIEVRPDALHGTRGFARFTPSIDRSEDTPRVAVLHVQGGVVIEADEQAALVFGRRGLIGVPLESLLDAEFDESVEAALDGRTDRVPLVRYHSAGGPAGLADVHFDSIDVRAVPTWRLTFYPLAEQPEARYELARLASYAQNHPHAIVEVTASGIVRFVNDTAHRSLPELAERGLDHPFLCDLFDLTLALGESASVSRTVLLPDGRCFEQEVRRMAGGNVRLFAWDVTRASQAAHALRDQTLQSEILRDSLVYERDMARTLMDTLAQPLFVADENGRTKYINPAAATLIGRSLSDVLGIPLVDMVYPDDRAIAQERFRNRSVTGQERYELRLDSADGSVRKGLISAAPLQRADGSPAGSIAAFTDLTEQDEHQRRVETLRQFYEDVLSELPIEVSVLDAEGRYLYVNPETARNPLRRAAFIGRRPSQIDVRSAEESRVMEARQSWIATITETATRISLVERRPTPRPGETRFIELTGIPLLGEDGRVAFVVVYGVDIGEAVAYEREQIMARRAAEEMDALKTTLVANMSHEIRTPLTAIIGFADLLRDDLPLDMDREPLDLIKSSGERLLGTLNDILDSARLASRSFHFDLRPMDVRDIVRGTADLFRTEAEQRGLFVTCRAPQSPVRAAVNADALRRALSHVIGNAVRFTYSGGVEIDVRANDRKVEIVISDSGVGIDPAFAPHLFEPFRQASVGAARSHQGIGLGLSIAQGLIRLMEGEIEVDTAMEAGSTFTLRFPLLFEPADA